jgi:hypothetical protein
MKSVQLSQQLPMVVLPMETNRQDWCSPLRVVELVHQPNIDCLRIDSSGRVGIGISSPDSSSLLFVNGTSSAALDNSSALFNQANPAFLQVKNNTDAISDPEAGIIFQPRNTQNGAVAVYAKRTAGFTSDLIFRFRTGSALSAEVARLTSSGRLGIGTISPSSPFVVSDGGAGGVELHGNSSGDGRLLAYNRSGAAYIGMRYNALNHQFSISDTERVRIDPSGRLLVGTSTARTAWNNSGIGSNALQVERAGEGGDAAISICANSGTSSAAITAAVLYLGKTRGTTVGSTTVVASADCLGRVSFQGSDGTQQVEAAKVEAFVDATPGANDMPGRLVFSTTADGASSPTERVRIESGGKTKFSGGAYGIERTATAAAFDLNTGNFWTCGAIAIPNPTNQVAGMMGSLRVTAAPTSFAANWKHPGGTYTAPTTFPAVAPFYVQASGTILLGSWTEGIA